MPPKAKDTKTTDVEAPLVNAEQESDICPEHFPAGWKSRSIVYTNERLGIEQPSVTCEHGTYTRPVKAAADDTSKDDELAALRARIAELEAAAPKAEGEPKP